MQMWKGSGISDTRKQEKGQEYLIHEDVEVVWNFYNLICTLIRFCGSGLEFLTGKGSGISDACRCERGLEFLMQVDRNRVRNF